VNLEDFVSESLAQIVNGVKKAQTAVARTGARVAPLMRGTTDASSIGAADGDGGQPVYPVEFDLVVSAAEGTGTKGGIGVVVGVFGLGSQGQSESKTGHETRLRFKVPLLLPPQARQSNP
jgi:hypothetical protein